ncbi:MAG: site-specific integrase [Candidatus Omnitrophota bacterium]
MSARIKYPKKTNYRGVRMTGPGKYELAYYPYKGAKEKKYKTDNFKTAKQASDKRLELIAESRKASSVPAEVRSRLNADFAYAWERLEIDLSALPRKTILHCKRTYNRMFYDFRLRMFPSIKGPKEAEYTFFNEYKNFYCNTLDRAKGWRAEITYMKIIMNRLRRLGFCTKEIIEELKQMKRPQAVIPDYPIISSAKIAMLLDFIRHDRLDIYKATYFMKRTGRRVEETTLIERRDVEWDGLRLVRINIRPETTKNKKPAPLDIFDDELENFIRQAYKESSRHNAPYLFLSRRYKKLNQRRICDYLKKVSENIIGVKITPHYFRRRFCTECVREGVSYKDIMAICGLRDIKVLVKYYDQGSFEGKNRALEVSCR